MTDIIMGGKVTQSARYGLMTYEDAMTNEEYREQKRRRKDMYRQRHYEILSETEKKLNQLAETRKILNDLRQRWFKTQCSGQCMDFNCIKCEEMRKPIKQELDKKEIELTNS